MKKYPSTCQLLFMLLLMVAMLAPAISSEAHADSHTPSILIINSYHKGLRWTDSQLEGIACSLMESGYESNIYIEYMDWKRYPTGENLTHFYEHMDYKYSKKRIDIIITTDDIALEFAKEYRAKLFSDAPIIFCGVNDEGISRLVTGEKRITGICEVIDPVNTVLTALRMKPKTKEIYVVFDNTESGLSTGRTTLEAIKAVGPDIKLHAMNRMGIDELLESITEASEDSLILLTTYYKDYNGRDVGFEELTGRVCEKSEVPVFHLYDFGLGEGAVGGSVLSGEADGKRAGALAARVLAGESVLDIPIETQQSLKYIFDYQQLVRHNIDMETVPEGSEIINRPFNFYEAYRSIINTVIVIFLMLITFIFILLHYLRKISMMKKELQLNNEELVRSGNALRQQYEELEKVQKELITSEQRYYLLFQRMLNGFIVLEPVYDSRGRITDIRFVRVNPAYELQTGFKESDIIGKPWKKVFGFPNTNLNIYNEILKTGEPRHFETYHTYDSRYYLISAFKLSDSQVGIVVDDITDYRRAIKEITTLKEKLEQRVAKRTEELQNAIDELEAFTYTVSHDLKSPLRAVEGYSRIILEDYADKLGQDGTEMLQNIRNISNDMIEMTSRLLQYSVTSKAPIDKERIETEILVRSIFSQMLSAYPGRNVKLNIETGLPDVFADKIMLRQVINNILSNAFKFTRYRDEACISVGCTITSEEYVFYFKDNGVGFDMEYSQKLFGIFQRLHTSEEFEGSGIGLVTVKKIIQRHGGRVWIEGKTGVGAEVYFTLPYSW